jgi:dipeptidase E
MGADITPIRVLLGSGGIATEARRKLYRDLVSEHFSDCEEVLFVPFASEDHDTYTSRMQGFLGPEGPRLVSIHEFDDQVSAVNVATGIYVGGGNSFLLVRDLHEFGLIEPIRDRVMAGAPYLGVSAGSNVACPTMMTTNDMPIVLPQSFDSFGIVPFQINPHYHPGKVLFMDGEQVTEHYGESRAQRIAEFHRHQETPVLGMWEGSFVQWDGFRGTLIGRATAFSPGSDPVEIEDGFEFGSELNIFNN